MTRSVPLAPPVPDGTLSPVLPPGAALLRAAPRVLAIAARLLKTVAVVTIALAWIGGIATLVWGTVSWFAEFQLLPPHEFFGWPQ
jgi:hypothetical protein